MLQLDWLYGRAKVLTCSLGEAIKKHGRDKFIIASKFGVVRNKAGAMVGFSAAPDSARKALDNTLQRLGLSLSSFILFSLLVLLSSPPLLVYCLLYSPFKVLIYPQGTDYVDIYMPARVDPKTPIEETVCINLYFKILYY